jgi:hypothetical protein
MAVHALTSSRPDGSATLFSLPQRSRPGRPICLIGVPHRRGRRFQLPCCPPAERASSHGLKKYRVPAIAFAIALLDRRNQTARRDWTRCIAMPSSSSIATSPAPLHKRNNFRRQCLICLDAMRPTTPVASRSTERQGPRYSIPGPRRGSARATK